MKYLTLLLLMVFVATCLHAQESKLSGKYVISKIAKYENGKFIQEADMNKLGGCPYSYEFFENGRFIQSGFDDDDCKEEFSFSGQYTAYNNILTLNIDGDLDNYEIESKSNNGLVLTVTERESRGFQGEIEVKYKYTFNKIIEESKSGNSNNDSDLYDAYFNNIRRERMYDKNPNTTSKNTQTNTDHNTNTTRSNLPIDIQKLENDMVYIQSGTFDMGCEGENCSASALPIHEVSLNSFYMLKYEITVSMFSSFVSATGYKTDAEKKGYVIFNPNRAKGVAEDKRMGINWRYDSNGKVLSIDDYHKYPVAYISWNDAVAYCEWLSQLTNKKYRLPTEAEWEYAAQGGQFSQHFFYSGTNDISERNKPNELGLYHMTSNFYQWCNDWYAGDYYIHSEKTNPKGPSAGQQKVARGGGINYGGNIEVFIRHQFSKDGSWAPFYTGFRVVLTQ